MISKRDVQLGKIALKQGMIDKEQLKRSLALQKKLAKKGKKVALGSLLIKKDYITKDQLEEIVRLHNESLDGEDDGAKSRRAKRASRREKKAKSRREKAVEDADADEGDEAAKKKKKKSRKAAASTDDAADAKKGKGGGGEKKDTKRRSRRASSADDDEPGAATATKKASKTSNRSKRAKTSREARKSKRSKAQAALKAKEDDDSQLESAVEGVDPGIFQSAHDGDVETDRRRLIGCPECGKKYRVRQKQVGKRFNCRRCKYRIKVPRDLFVRPLSGAGGVEVEEFVLASSDQASSGEIDVQQTEKAAAVAAAAVKTIGAKTSIRELAMAAQKQQAKPLAPQAKFGVKGLLTMVACLAVVGGLVAGVVIHFQNKAAEVERLAQERRDKELQKWQSAVDVAMTKAQEGATAKNPDAIGGGLAELEIARSGKRSLLQGNNKQRAEAYEQEQGFDAKVRELYLIRGSLVLDRGGLRAAESIQDFERAAALGPDHEETQLKLGRTRILARRYAEAAEGLAGITSVSERGLALQGYAWEQGGAGAKAAESYGKLQDPLGPVLAGRALAGQGEHGKALDALGKAQGLQGIDQAAAKVVEALAHEGKGNQTQARSALDAAVRAGSDSPYPHLARAAFLLRQGTDPDLALKDVKNGNAQGATPWGFYLQGEVYLQLLDERQALASYTEAAQVTSLPEGRLVADEVRPFLPSAPPDYKVLARCRLAFAHGLAGRLDAARVEISRAQQQNPFSPFAQAAMAHLELLQPEPQVRSESETLFRSALQLSMRVGGVEKQEPIRSVSTAYLLLVYGALLIQRARYEDAIKNLEQAASLDPTLLAAAATLRGDANKRNSQVTRAQEAYQEASRREAEDPTYQRAFSLLDELYSKPAKLESAVQALLLRNPYHAHALALRARLHARRSAPKEALADLERALALNPELPLLYTTRALLFLRDLPQAMHDVGQAGRDLDEALARERRVGGPKAMTLFVQALFHARRGEVEIALRILGQCLAKDQAFAQAYKLRAKLYEQKGQQAKAQKDLKRYKELSK